MRNSIVGLDQHRDPDGAIGQRHGNTVISTLRSIYGPSFAPDCQPTDMLSDVLSELDAISLKHLVDDHETGKLNEKLVEQA